MMFRKDVIFKIVSVEREFRAATLAIDELLQRCLVDPTLLSLANISHGDVRACRKNSEITYLVRMFAVGDILTDGLP